MELTPAEFDTIVHEYLPVYIQHGPDAVATKIRKLLTLPPMEYSPEMEGLISLLWDPSIDEDTIHRVLSRGLVCFRITENAEGKQQNIIFYTEKGGIFYRADTYYGHINEHKIGDYTAFEALIPTLDGGGFHFVSLLPV